MTSSLFMTQPLLIGWSLVAGKPSYYYPIHLLDEIGKTLKP